MIPLVLQPGRSDWLLFVHVAAALLLFGGAVAVAVAGTAAARTRELRRVAVLARVSYRLDVLVVWPSLVVVVAAGSPLAGDESAASGWITFAGVLTGLVAAGAALTTLLDRRRLRAAELALEQGAASSPELERLNRGGLRGLAGALAPILLVVLLWLMTAKPGFVG